MDQASVSTGVNVLGLSEENMTVQVQQVLQEGQQTLLVTAQPVSTTDSDVQGINDQHQE